MSSPAVLSGGVLARPDRRWVRVEPGSLPAVAAAAVSLNVGVVYALDEGQALAGGDGWREPQVTGGVAGGAIPPWRVHIGTELEGFVCQGGGRGGRVGAQVVIVWPAHDSQLSAGPWQGHEPLELLEAFGELERLGVPWSHSLAATMTGLVLSTHPLKKGGRKLDEAPACPEPAKSGTLEMPWLWRRELTTDEAAASWVHVFDVNAQYLSAWGTSELGFGVAHHMERPRFDRDRAGVWRLEHLPVLPPSLLPPPWNGDGGRTDGAGRWPLWFTTPTLARVLEVCEGLDVPLVAEAWVWPERSRYLRAAAERLRDARASLRATIAAAAQAERSSADLDAVAAAIRRRAIAQTALEGVGHVYKRGTQWLSMTPDENLHAAPAWYRPDWGHTIRAQARVNLHRRIAELGRAPFALDVDALMFATDVEDAGEFAELARIRLGDGLGQFKHSATGPMRPEFAELNAPQITRTLMEVV